MYTALLSSGTTGGQCVDTGGRPLGLKAASEFESCRKRGINHVSSQALQRYLYRWLGTVPEQPQITTIVLVEHFLQCGRCCFAHVHTRARTQERTSTHPHIHTSTHPHIRTRANTHMHTCTYARMPKCANTHACMHACTDANSYTHTRNHSHARTGFLAR